MTSLYGKVTSINVITISSQFISLSSSLFFILSLSSSLFLCLLRRAEVEIKLLHEHRSESVVILYGVLQLTWKAYQIPLLVWSYSRHVRRSSWRRPSAYAAVLSHSAQPLSRHGRACVDACPSQLWSLLLLCRTEHPRVSFCLDKYFMYCIFHSKEHTFEIVILINLYYSFVRQVFRGE